MFIEGGNVMTSSVVMDTKMMCVEEDVSKYKGEKARHSSKISFNFFL